MTSSTTALTSSDPDGYCEGGHPPMRGWIVLAGLAALGLFMAAVAILYVQWLRNENPNASIVLQGELKLDEATVTITPHGAAAGESIMAQFKNGQNHRLHFHLPPGAYRVIVRNPAGRLLFPEDPDREFLIDAMKPVYIRLEVNPPASRPAASRLQGSSN